MIYKFIENGGKTSLEVVKSECDTTVLFVIAGMGRVNEIELTKDQLFDLIGALHSLKSKLSD